MNAVAPAASPVVAVDGLTCGYTVNSGWFRRKRIEAVRTVDLELRQNEVLALVGESGSGKSTLARAIAGLLKPQSGTIRFNGQEIGRHNRAQAREFRRQRAIVFQNPYRSLNPRMRIGAALAETLTVSKAVPHHEVSTEVDRLLANVGLPLEYRTKYPLALSGGERQRVAIARSMAGRPALLIADEITSALDVSVSAQIINLVLDLRSERKFACLFITHDLPLATAVADRIAIMKEGLIVDSGTPQHLLTESTNEYTRDLLSPVDSSLDDSSLGAGGTAKRATGEQHRARADPPSANQSYAT